jgi:hypothetical protein
MRLGRDAGVAGALRHQPEHVQLTLAQLGQRRAGLAGPLREKALHDRRVEHRAAGRDLVDGPDQLLRVADPELVQVGIARDAIGEQRPDVLLVVVLREDDDTTTREC